MYKTQSPDTAYWAERLQFDAWRKLSPGEKAGLVSAMCGTAHELCLTGLRQQYPHAAEEELELRAAVRRLGADVVARVTGRRLDR